VGEKLVMVGVLPEAVVIDAGEQVIWFSNAGNLKVEFDPQRCPLSSNVYQAPPGIRVSSGPSRPGLNPGSYKYRLSLNDAVITHGEVLVRGKNSP
jgi:hypothetical protein